MSGTTHPPNREDEAEEYVDRLLEAVPGYVATAIETAAETEDSVSIYGNVDDARVVVEYYSDEVLEPHSHVEFGRYKQTGVSNVTVKFEP